MAKDITPPNLSTNNNQPNPPTGGTEPQLSPKPVSSDSSAVIKPKTRVKPLVEGINAPRNTSDIVYLKPDAGGAPSTTPLTDTEKTLIANTPDFKQETPKLISETSPINPNKPKSGIAGWFIAVVILLILIAAGYGLYSWKQSPKPPVNNIPSAPVLQTQTPPDTSATQSSTATPGSNIAETASTTPATTTPAAAPAPVLKLIINSTPTGYLNVRSLPATNGTLIAKVKPGEIYTYTNTQNGWYQITLNDGSSGWVSGQYVTLQ
jgi:hypothetical protein